MTDIKINCIMSKVLKDKLDWLVQNYSQEIGGWITGSISKEGILMEDLLIPEQEVGSALVEMSGKQIALLRKEFGKRCEKIIGEWHSHNTMGKFFSSVDEDLIKQFMGPRTIAIFIVSSKPEGHRIRLEIRKPYQISIDNLEYTVESDKDIEDFLKKEIKKKVTEKTYSGYYPGYSGLGGSQTRLPVEIERVRDYETPERLLKERIKGMLEYRDLNKQIIIWDLPWYYADALCNEWQDFKPQMVSMGDENHHKIVFTCANKEKAIELMRDLSDYLKNLLLEMDETMMGGCEGY